MKRIVLLLFLVFSSLLVSAQYKLTSLTGGERPHLEDPIKFAADLKQKAIEIVRKRLGAAYDRMVDTSYRYPHYYDNVYFNSAPSEMNYRVYFSMNRGKPGHYEFELVFSKEKLELVHPIEEYLPDCALFPGRCKFISSQEAIRISHEKFKKEIAPKGTVHFSYDAKRKTFIYSYRTAQMVDYPRGKEGTAVLDANSGKILTSKYDPSAYMGRQP